MLRLLACATLSLTIAGCATVTRGTSNDVQVNSEPSGASVRTSMNQTCTTPCTLRVSRKDEFSVVVSKPGYHEETVEVKTQLAGAGAAGFAGNVIVGGVVGMGVDAATGSTLEHVPNPVSVTLRPIGPAAALKEKLARVKKRSPKPAAQPPAAPAS